MSDVDRRMEEINVQNRKRAATGEDNPLTRKKLKSGGGEPGAPPDFHHYGKDMHLPYLPYSFTDTCAWCGKTGVQPDTKNMLPLGFVGVLLEDVYARTPFVYNVLYQMVHCPEHETAEAIKWQKINGRRIPDYMRGRVCVCTQCMPPIRERACCGGTASPGSVKSPCPLGAEAATPSLEPVENALAEDDGGEEPDPPEGGGEHHHFDPTVVTDTKVAFDRSFDPQADEWEIKTAPRIRTTSSAVYQKEAGRKFQKPMRMMMPMDLVMMMLYHPSPDRVPEYRMLNRLLRTLAGLSGGEGEESTDQTKSKCLYLSFPLLALHTLAAQVRSKQILLKGMPQRGNGTISDRVHMSAYASGGKRRVTQGDSQHAVIARRCHGMLQSAGMEGRQKASPSDRLVHLGGFKRS